MRTVRSMKSTTRTVAATLGTILVAGGLVSCAATSSDPGVSSGPSSTAEATVDLSSLPVSTMAASWVVDMGNPNKVAGLVDYVFVAHVISADGTTYSNVVTMPVEGGGTKTVGTPMSHYTVEVIDNIKGKLKKNEPIPVTKEGGIAMDHKSIYLFEGDQFPQPGSYYIMMASGQTDGSLLNIGGPGTTITLNATTKAEIVSSDTYKAYVKAVQNQIPLNMNRQHFKSKYDDSGA